MSTSPFEGVEKKLVLVLDSRFPLRTIPKEAWESEVLTPIGCQVLKETSGTSDSRFNGYLLSESSMFVYDSAIVLKTCGTTTPAAAVPLICTLVERQAAGDLSLDFLGKRRTMNGDFDLEDQYRVKSPSTTATSTSGDFDAEDGDATPSESFQVSPMRTEVEEASCIAAEANSNPRLVVKKSQSSDCPSPIRSLLFTHLSYQHASSQKSPHRNFGEETAYLSGLVRGGGEASKFDLSPQRSLHIFRWSAAGEDSEEETEGANLRLFSSEEAIFFGVDENCSENFASRFRPQSLPSGSFADYWFQPVGYSSNTHLGPGRYLSVHASPEPATSYASIEDSTFAFGASCKTRVPRWNEKLSLWRDWISPFVPTECHLVSLRFGDASDNEAVQGSRQKVLGLDGQTLLLDRSMSVHVSGDLTLDHCVYKRARSRPAPRGFSRGFVRETVASLGFEFVSTNGMTDSSPSTILRNRILETGEDRALMLVDIATVIRQHRRWTKRLPRVVPFYAFKCNSDPVLLRVLADLGVGFDCASPAEIITVLRDLQKSPCEIVYSNPCKQRSALEFARDNGVHLTVFDNSEELKKIRDTMPEGRLLLRIRVEDEGSQCPMSGKFGAPQSKWSELLGEAAQLQLNVIGVHFHVGSGCSKKGAFTHALSRSREAFDLADRQFGFKFDVLDIGGGFPGDTSSTLFESMAIEIEEGLTSLFADTVRVIAEPGRYYVAASHHLALNIFGLRERIFAPGSRPMAEGAGNLHQTTSASETTDSSMLYFINDGLYGALNCVLYDHAVVVPIPLIRRGGRDDDEPRQSIVFGQTCDGFDQVASVDLLPCQLDDWLLFSEVGAYSVAAASNFNGFSLPYTFYTMSATL